MENRFVRADSSNLPRIDVMMVANFFANNSDFISAEFRNVKTVISSRETYGNDAIGYVQVWRENDLCVVKCKMCPEHKVHNKQYNVTLTVNEKTAQVVSVTCHDCVASKGGCKHSVAFLMWAHRRSEEPSCTSVQCYWKKPKLAQVGRTMKFLTARQMCNKPGALTTKNDRVLELFLAKVKQQGIKNCQLIKYQTDYEISGVKKLSLHYLSIKYNKDMDSDKFLNIINSVFTKEMIELVEKETTDQHKSPLWFELRYGRITGSRAYEVSQCKTSDGSLVQIVMGARTPDTPAMKRGRLLEEKVREVVESNLGAKINKCGLFLSSKQPIVAASPDGIICNDEGRALIEIKCPVSSQTYKNYVQNGIISKKCMCQIQIQMYVSNIKKSYFCVADPNFEINRQVTIIQADYDEGFVQNILDKVLLFWKKNIYPALYKSTIIE